MHRCTTAHKARRGVVHNFIREVKVSLGLNTYKPENFLFFFLTKKEKKKKEKKMLMKINSPPGHFYLLSKSFTRSEISNSVWQSAKCTTKKHNKKVTTKKWNVIAFVMYGSQLLRRPDTYHYIDTSLLNCANQKGETNLITDQLKQFTINYQPYSQTRVKEWGRTPNLNKKKQQKKTQQQRKTPASQHSKAREKAETTGFRNRKMQL